MIIIDKDKAHTTIMGRRREKDGSVKEAPMQASEVKSEEGEPDPRHEAAKDILSALHEKHPAKLMEALAAFHDLHKMHSEKASEVESAES